MMSQHSGDPFAALIRVNTVVQAVVGNGNRDIRGGTRAEYQGSKGRQILIQNEINIPESKHNDQTETGVNAQKCQPGQYNTSHECLCECGLSSPIDEHQVH